MDEINVKKVDLLRKLETNLVLHKAVFEEAMVAFKKNYISLLSEMVKKGKKNKFEFNITLQKPQNFTQNYKNAITMVKMDCRDIIVLSEDEFMRYVLNKWNWMSTFRSSYMSNITYGMSGTSGSSGSSGMSGSAKQYFGNDDEN